MGAIKRLFSGKRRNIPKVAPGTVIDIGRFGGFDVAFRTSTTDMEVIDESFGRDIHFSGTPEYQPAKDDVIIDVGGHIGTFALLAASKAPEGRVYVVEASLESFNLARINIALNDVKNVSPFHLALSDRKGVVRLHHDIGNWGHSIVKKLTESGEDVRSDTLAGFMAENGIVRCDFMKMNCEGAEFPILLSASPETLGKFGVILVLYHCDLYEGATEKDLAKHLESAGLKIKFRKRTTNRGWLVAVNPQRHP